MNPTLPGRRLRRLVARAFRAPTIRRVVFGIPETPAVSEAACALGLAGLEVTFAESAEEARRLAIGHSETAVVVPLAKESEGGLLATAKLVNALPAAKVVLVAPQQDDRVALFADFIDAKVAWLTSGPSGLIAAIME